MKINLNYKMKSNLFISRLFFVIVILEVINFYCNHNKLLFELLIFTMLFFINKENEYKWKGNLVYLGVSPSNLTMGSEIEFVVNSPNHPFQSPCITFKRIHYSFANYGFLLFVNSISIQIKTMLKLIFNVIYTYIYIYIY